MRYKISQFSFVLAIGLGCATLCRAQETLRVPESAIRIQFQSNATVIDFPIENTSKETTSAHIALQLIDPSGLIQSQGDLTISLSPGSTKAQLNLPAVMASEKDQDESHLFLYRLRYSVAANPSGDAAFQRLEGIVSVGEVSPQFFELHVAAPDRVRERGHYALHVRAIHPVTSVAAKGVVVQASIDTDDDSDECDPLVTGKAVTDSRGFATLDFTLPASLKTDRLDVTVTGTRDEFIASVDSDLVVGGWISASISTDKPLYQPGQALHMRLLAFDTNKNALADQKVILEISDPEETLINRVETKTSQYGIASADWQIPNNLRLGKYTIKAKFDNDRDKYPRASTSVKISRYELPTFSVAARPDRAYYLPGQNAAVEIRANYVYGQPVQRGHVRLVHETEREWNYREQKWDAEESDTYEGETDSQGKFVVHVDLSKEHEAIADESYNRFSDVTYSVYFTDSVTGRTENRRFDLRITRDPIHIYVIHGGNSPYLSDLYISTDYADGTPAQCEVQIKWTSSLSSNKRDATSIVKERVLRRVRTNRYGVAKVSDLGAPDDDDSSEIDLVFDARDGKGLSGHQTERVWSFEQAHIRVATNKNLYQEGEPIEVELKSREPDVSVVVDAVHDGRVVASSVVRMHHARGSVVFPPNNKFQNEVTIAAYAFGIHAERDSGESKFESYRNVLFPKNHELSLDVRLAKTNYRPGENASADLRISGPDGKETRGAIGLVVVDKAVEERQRSDQDFRADAGFFEFRRMIDDESLSGIRLSDLDKLDLSKPLPDGFELVAEILMQSGSEESLKFFDVDSAGGNASKLFAGVIEPQMKSIRAALDERYAKDKEYPKTEAALATFLLAGGINFTGLRDPWGVPYRASFTVERELDVLNLWSSGPDKSFETSDDFRVLTMKWPYFKKYSEAISLAVDAFHERTGGYIRDEATLIAELAAHGIQFNALKDPWGHAYRTKFGISQNRFTITVTSAGPDGLFDADEDSYGDDFSVANAGIDYFKETRAKIDKALSENFSKTLDYPENIDQLRKVLRDYGINWDELKDPWGHPYMALFSQEPRYANDIVVKSYQDNLGNDLHHTTIVPVTQYVEFIHIRSAGPSSGDKTPRDFSVASFSHTVIKQTSTDRSPEFLTGQPVLASGMGAIAGTVLDPSGRLIVGAEVTAKNSETGSVFMAISNQEGSYSLRNIPPGHYVVAISSADFKTSIITNVAVFSGNTTSVNSTLDLGLSAVMVEVEASGGQVLETQSASAVSAEVSAGTPKSSQPPPLISTPRLRQYFPETLYWQPELVTDSHGRAHLSFPLADNITTWTLSALASTKMGELATAERDIRAFQPFFVEHDPPPFLTEGDEIDLPVVLRNYMNRSLRMKVEMKPEEWFVPLSPASTKAEVPAGDTATEVFKFRATATVKNGKQRITATEANAATGDAIERTVTVRPNGEEKTDTRSQVFEDTAALELQIPAQAFPGSLEGELKIYPNLNAHVLESVESILKRPYGCAEQDISSAYPSILLLKYLKSAGMESSPLAPRARRYIQQGYERLLSYRAPHGGFSYWGNGDADLALTAYALRFLNDASEFVAIDDSIVDEQLRWILRLAASDGRWVARDWNHKEDSHRTMILTAYIARTISDLDMHDTGSNSNEKLMKDASLALKYALDYLKPKVAETDDPYLIASYALALPKSDVDPRLAACIDRLRKLERREADTSYWMLETNTPFYGWGLAGRVETTALVLQALKKSNTNGNSIADRELLSRGLLFLLKKQDRYGIWYSSQATINVLEALRILSLRSDGTSGVSSGQSAQSSKADILLDGRAVQSVDLPSSNDLVAPVTVDISKYLSPGNHRLEIRRSAGSTPASVQAVAVYYVPWAMTTSSAGLEHEEKASDSLRLSVHFDKLSATPGESIQCNVDAERIGFLGYGMMLAEIGLPPGAEVDRESLERAKNEAGWAIDQYDVLPDRIVFYLWPHAGGTKFAFAFKSRYGFKALTAPSVLYDYYNPEAQATVGPTLFTVRQ